MYDISCIGSTPITVLAFGSKVRKMQCCFLSESGSSFFLNADPDPDPGIQTNADQDPEPGQTFKGTQA
jgi:hypothetical protein